MTAAPRIIFASRVWSLPRSLNTRAVMPTLVAESVAPRNRRVGVDASGRSTEPAPKPSKNGAMIPTTATTKAFAPTPSISLTLVS